MTGSGHAIPVIDVHVHISPEAAQAWLQVMQVNNLSQVVNLGMIERLGLPYREGMRAFGERLGERMVHFATPDFSATAPGFGARLASELERKAQAGARGLKIFKDLGLRHPHTTFIGAHLGNYPENLAYVDGCLERYPNFCVETSARIGEIGRHPVEQVRQFFVKHQDRILFGTDLGVHSAGLEDVDRYTAIYDAHWSYFETHERQIPYPGYPIQGRWKVDAIGLPVEILEKLYYRNAERLIPALRE